MLGFLAPAFTPCRKASQCLYNLTLPGSVLGSQWAPLQEEPYPSLNVWLSIWYLSLEPFSVFGDNSSMLFCVEKGKQELLTVDPGRAVSLDSGF